MKLLKNFRAPSIERIFQHAENRPIVFRGSEQNRIAALIRARTATRAGSGAS
jgi:hypothetical protein